MISQQQEDFKNFDFNKFFAAFEKVKEVTNTVSKCFHVPQLTFNLNETYNKNIEMAVVLRTSLNTDVKRIKHIESMKRRDDLDVEIKGLTAEFALSTLFFHCLKSNKNYRLTFPALVEISLAKQPDYRLTSATGSEICFDLKAQWTDNSFNYWTVNKNHHDTYLSKNNFYLACITDRNEKGEATQCNFYVVTKKFFNDNAYLVLTSTSKNFSPYYRIPLHKIIQNKKGT